MPFVEGIADLPLQDPTDDGTTPLGPPRLLLQAGGPDLLPGESLELDASLLAALVRSPSRQPLRWSAPAFAREVEVVRAHLRPIASRPALAASFGREAFHGLAGPGMHPTLGGSAVRVAYALRWLELGDAVPRARWSALLAGISAG